MTHRTLPLDLPDLYRPFEETPPLATLRDAAEVPQPYRSLLAHEGHMTTTLERHWQTKVTLEVLATHHEEPLYTRKILLRHGETGAVVQFGVMQFDFRSCPAEVRDEILEQATPLGRILINHGLLRRISTHALLEIEADEEIRRALGFSATDVGPPRHIWGRLATIYVDEQPAVALLESLP